MLLLAISSNGSPGGTDLRHCPGTVLPHSRGTDPRAWSLIARTNPRIG